jgi:hypothetical protein
VIAKPGKLNVRPDHLSRVTNGEEPTNLEDNFPDAQLFSVQVAKEYFCNIIEYLSTWTTPQAFNTTQKKNLVVKVVDYQLITGRLYKMGVNKILRRYVLEHEIPRILAESHEGIVGGNCVGKATTWAYGGQQFTEMIRNISRDVMFVKGSVNLIEGMRCP